MKGYVMLIKKTYHFYAAHRNEELHGSKCQSLHGHRYGITCWFEVQRDSQNFTVLFEAFDVVEDYLKKQWDHAHIVNQHDPLYDVLKHLGMRQKVLIRPPSVENICFELFNAIIEMGFELQQIEVQETDSSSICYNRADYLYDLAFFEFQEEHECDFSNPKKMRCDTCGKTRYQYRSTARRKARDSERPDSGTSVSGSADSQ